MNVAERYLYVRAQLPVQHLGSLMAAESRVPDMREVDDLAVRVVNTIEPVDERTFRARGPWHAEAWLLIMANLAAQVAHRTRRPDLRLPYDPRLGALLLRGQRNPDWGLTPSAHRLSDPDQAIAGHALSVFAAAMVETFASPDNRMNSPYAHFAAAQHYGLETHLLDFTPDPHIAVFFACLNAMPDSEVVVYGLPMVTASRLSAAFVLPPPWLHRVYRQRGVFLDCLDLADRDFVRAQCPLRILFPADPEYLERVVKAEAEAILPVDLWYDKAVVWAKELARKSYPDPPLKMGFAAALEKSCGVSPHLLFFNTLDDPRWIDRVVSLIEWLTLKLVDGKLTYDISALEALLFHNEALFRSLRIVHRFLAAQVSPDRLRLNHTMYALESIAAVLDSVSPLPETPPPAPASDKARR